MSESHTDYTGDCTEEYRRDRRSRLRRSRCPGRARHDGLRVEEVALVPASSVSDAVVYPVVAPSPVVTLTSPVSACVRFALGNQY